MAGKAVTDAKADKAFAEPDHTDQAVPAASLSPAESLQRDEELAKNTERDRKVAEKQAEELKEVRAEQGIVLQDFHYRNPSEQHFVIAPTEGKGGEGSISGFTGDGRLTLEASGKVVLDHDAVVNFANQLDAAAQATS